MRTNCCRADLAKLFARILLIASITLTSAKGVPVCAADSMELPQSERDLFVKTTFEPATSTKDLPPGVSSALGQSGDKKQMAEPSENWSAGCTGGPNVPRQRFIFGGVSPERCFVYFERGGIAHFFVFQLYNVSGKKVELIHQSMSGKQYKSVDELKKAMSKGEIH